MFGLSREIIEHVCHQEAPKIPKVTQTFFEGVDQEIQVDIVPKQRTPLKSNKRGGKGRISDLSPDKGSKINDSAQSKSSNNGNQGIRFNSQ